MVCKGPKGAVHGVGLLLTDCNVALACSMHGFELNKYFTSCMQHLLPCDPHVLFFV
jgi:hypothetical protein